jgi:hypothetical protein
MQQSGQGKTGGAIVGGLLSIYDNPMEVRWIKIEEELGQDLIKMGTEIIKVNILQERTLSKKKVTRAAQSSASPPTQDGTIAGGQGKLTNVTRATTSLW